MNTKVLIVLVVLLVVLFVLGIGAGVSDIFNDFNWEVNLRSEQAQNAKTSLTTRLKTSEIAVDASSPGECRLQNGQLVIPTDETCVFRVKKALENQNADYRSLKLDFTAGPSTNIQLTVKQPQADAIDINKELERGENFTIDFHRAAGELTIQNCRDASEEDQENQNNCMIQLN